MASSDAGSQGGKKQGRKMSGGSDGVKKKGIFRFFNRKGGGNGPQKSGVARSASADSAQADGNPNEAPLDFRDVPPSMFLLQPLLEAPQQMQLTIGDLYVHVVEARGLKAGDLNGKSDPYCKLKLTGCFLSHGQEWPVAHQHSVATDVCNRTLQPRWDEEFSFPVWRAGAVLRVWVYDWDRNSEDDLLGCLEVPLQGELMSQKVVDRWFPLQPFMAGVPTEATWQAIDAADEAAVDAADGIERKTGSSADALAVADAVAAAKVGEVLSDVSDAEGDGRGKGTAAFAAGASALDGTSASWEDAVSLNGDNVGGADLFSPSGDSLRSPTPQDRVRRRGFGLGRKGKKATSGGKGAASGERGPGGDLGSIRLRLWFQFDELGEFCSHMWLEDPFRPELEHFSPNRCYRKFMRVWHLFQPYLRVLKIADDVVSWVKPRQSFQLMGMVLLFLALPPLAFVCLHAFGYYCLVTNYRSYQEKLAKAKAADDAEEDARVTRRRTFPTPSPALQLQPRLLTGPGGISGSGSAELNGKMANGHNRNGSNGSGGALGGGIVVSRSASGDKANGGSSDGLANGGDGAAAQNEAARAHLRAGVQATVAAQRLGRPTEGPSVGPLWQNNFKKPAREASPTLHTDDIELIELEKRLQGNRQFHTVINEMGKRFGKKSGPMVQHKLQVLAIDMIMVRKRWHPHNLTQVAEMSVALFIHFCYIMYMYRNGRFNLYIASGLFGYFTRKFVKKRGYAAYLGLRQAINNRKLICELKSTPGMDCAISAGAGMTVASLMGLVKWRKRAGAATSGSSVTTVLPPPLPALPSSEPAPAAAEMPASTSVPSPEEAATRKLLGPGEPTALAAAAAAFSSHGQHRTSGASRLFPDSHGGSGGGSGRAAPRVIGGRRRKKRVRWDRVVTAVAAALAMPVLALAAWRGMSLLADERLWRVLGDWAARKACMFFERHGVLAPGGCHAVLATPRRGSGIDVDVAGSGSSGGNMEVAGSSRSGSGSGSSGGGVEVAGGSSGSGIGMTASKGEADLATVANSGGSSSGSGGSGSSSADAAAASEER